MSKSKSDKLKSYKGQLKRELSKKENIETQKKALASDHAANCKQIKYLQDKIKTIENSFKDPIVSDHAIVRYLERIIGMDIDALKEEILSEKTHSCKFKDNTVVTVYK